MFASAGSQALVAFFYCDFATGEELFTVANYFDIVNTISLVTIIHVLICVYRVVFNLISVDVLL
jgi:hypothetical protein